MKAVNGDKNVWIGLTWLSQSHQTSHFLHVYMNEERPHPPGQSGVEVRALLMSQFYFNVFLSKDSPFWMKYEKHF